MKTEFASVKLARPFVAWLKREAARRGIPMYELVEELAARGLRRPWRQPAREAERREG
jgi:hypothetical protein